MYNCIIWHQNHIHRHIDDLLIFKLLNEYNYVNVLNNIDK